VKFLDRNGLASLLAELSGEYDLYAPQEIDGGLVLRRLGPTREPPEVVWNEHRLREPLKSLWFQSAKVVAQWGQEPGEEPAPPRPRAVVGAKACDLRALEIIDKVFADHEFPEPAWCAARECNLIITGDCTGAAETCFCTMLGEAPHPDSGFDLNLAPVDGGYLVEVGSEKGENVVESFGALFKEPAPEMAKQRDGHRARVAAEVEQINERFAVRDPFERSVEKNLKTRIWGELAATCVQCNACNLVCPTCHCFLLKDVADEKACVRVSLWDSCFNAGYARMAGGGTPRLQLTERFKNHYFHKFVGFPRNWGVTACTGCGRCIDACMGRIDKRDCLHQLETRWIPSEMADEVS
jgi:NAD-dependent dihydropyrimidine dehydrogenase PreA subunit